MKRWLAIFSCVIICNSVSVQAETIRVASAANFYQTLEKIRIKFEQDTGHKVSIIRGSTGKLYSQIMHSAPFDVFLSADQRRADLLVAEGKSLGDISKIYAIGQLVLWSPDKKQPEDIRQILETSKFRKLAIANPKTAPYGQAAVEALKVLGVYETIKHKLVYAENIAQTQQFVASGAADLGLVARSLMKDQVFWVVASSLHQPIEQKMIVIKHSQHKQVAKLFYDYMSQPEILNIIRQDGYKI